MKGSTPRRRKKRERMTNSLLWRKPPSEDPKLIAIDPGDVYTGVAFFTTDEDGWYCMDAIELGWWDFLYGFEGLCFERPGTPPIVVYETWRLYGDHAKEKTGNEFLTSQLIGALKYIVDSNNRHANKHTLAEQEGKMVSCELPGGMCAEPDTRPVLIDLVPQRADIKKPTAGILRKKKISSVAKPIAREEYGGRDHIVDAELHGWHHILNTMGEHQNG